MVALLLAACGDDDDQQRAPQPMLDAATGTLTCDDAYADMGRARMELGARGYRRCSVDADCVHVDFNVSCERGVNLRTCGEYVASTSKEAAVQYIAEYSADLCDRLVSSGGKCNAGPKCAAFNAVCHEQQCVYGAPDGGVSR